MEFDPLRRDLPENRHRPWVVAEPYARKCDQLESVLMWMTVARHFAGLNFRPAHHLVGFLASSDKHEKQGPLMQRHLHSPQVYQRFSAPSCLTAKPPAGRQLPARRQPHPCRCWPSPTLRSATCRQRGFRHLGQGIVQGCSGGSLDASPSCSTGR